MSQDSIHLVGSGRTGARKARRTRLRLTVAVAVALAGACAPTLGHAQVPPHQPGTICLTPYLWCFINGVGPVGAPCGCPTPQGMVPGRLI